MANGDDRSLSISASIEVNPAQILDKIDVNGLFPDGTSVYLTDIGNESDSRMAQAAGMLQDYGYVPVPHFAARRFSDMDAFKARLAAFSNTITPKKALVIGGEADAPGIFNSSMELIETGALEDNGFEWIGVAGHPEGNRDISDTVIATELEKKNSYSVKTGTTMVIVTQFSFDGDGAVDWARHLMASGNKLPIHIGVAGPAKIPTLLKYAAMCGVGASLNFLIKKASAITTLATGYVPDELVDVIEAAWKESAETGIDGIHIFPFGGLKKTSEWLTERGSFIWTETGQSKAGICSGNQT